MLEMVEAILPNITVAYGRDNTHDVSTRFTFMMEDITRILKNITTPNIRRTASKISRRSSRWRKSSSVIS